MSSVEAPHCPTCDHPMVEAPGGRWVCTYAPGHGGGQHPVALRTSAEPERAPAASLDPDVADQRWLDGRVRELGQGIEAARAIWSNWYEGRRVGRLHPDMSPGEYIASLGLRLTLPEAMAALPGASNPQIAAVAGVDQSTVYRTRQRFADANPEPPARVRGADGKSYPARVVRTVTAEVIEAEQEEASIEEEQDDAPWRSLLSVMESIDALANSEATVIAATVPNRRRAATARRLRKLGTFLGRIAWTLEGSEEPK